MIKTPKYILFFASLFFVQLEAVDPFSKITITSERAVCKKDNSFKNVFVFNYLGNVIVTLADGSKITSKTLEISVDGKGIKVFEEKKKHSKHEKMKNEGRSDEGVSHVKKIMFKTNVKIFHKNRQAYSDSAEINIRDNTCRLDGNVKIIQSKLGAKKGIPLNIQGNRALINLKTSEITLLGNSRDPVSTVVELSREIFSPGRKKVQQ